MADKKNDGFSDFEKQAMKERAKELREEAKLEKNRAAGEAAILEKLAEMPDAERTIGEKLHALVTEVAPHLVPKTWYSMPAYTRGKGTPVVFFQAATKFESRYCSIGFNDTAALDDGVMWATAFAVTEWTDEVDAQLRALVAKAAS